MSKREIDVIFVGIWAMYIVFALTIFLSVVLDKPPVLPDCRDVILDGYKIIGTRPEHEGDCWRLR